MRNLFSSSEFICMTSAMGDGKKKPEEPEIIFASYSYIFMIKLFEDKYKIRAKSKITDLDWYFSRHNQKLKFLIHDLLLFMSPTAPTCPSPRLAVMVQITITEYKYNDTYRYSILYNGGLGIHCSQHTVVHLAMYCLIFSNLTHSGVMLVNNLTDSLTTLTLCVIIH